MKTGATVISEMTAVILAGGQGTRMHELTENIPNPDHDRGTPDPLAHHESHAAFGVRKFAIAAYKNHLIKHFSELPANANSIKVDLATGTFTNYECRGGLGGFNN